jgi:hypothetical protein
MTPYTRCVVSVEVTNDSCQIKYGPVKEIIKKAVWNDMKWIHFVQDRSHWWVSVKTEMYFWGP